ncbi:hypothetical protein EDEG_00341 [Edhazardia aedis USNM 41457]|uniref:Uncharacterized protein n=1 Tax=Edhazardia aedis (strain USNM 41457) TaxID=1003232 RepID=J9D2P5_EDHAE|nr:hypothetical protein EDEG_00341 [Edhazardia aedis USNM 41457]|eukprot:EJW01854.1 hypothetical protein EDEG_00341 [Edhazardia aedis USNM 41457]
MIVVLLICFSCMIIALTFRKKNDAFSNRTGLNDNFELMKYFDLKDQGVSNAVLQKHLLNAAIELERRKYDVAIEKDNIQELNQEKIIGHNLWKELSRQEKIHFIEKNHIEAEAEEMKEGWGSKIFDEAYSLFNKKRKDIEKTKKIINVYEDKLEIKKQDLLTRELIKNLKNGTIPIY